MNYTGTLSALYKIYIKNFLLAIITLGIYRFWGKTNIRRYMFSHIEINNSPLHFHGTPIELIKGFFKGYGVFLICNIILYTGNWIMVVPTCIILFYLVYVALIAHLRYILTRISLNGVHFNYSMNVFKAGAYLMMYSILNMLSLFIFSHYFIIKQQEITYNSIEYGHLKSAMRGVMPQYVLKMHVITLLLAPFTLGLSRLYFNAYVNKYIFDNFYMGEVQIKGHFTAKELFLFDLTNILLILFTVGFAAPYVVHRTLKFNAKYFEIKGQLVTAENKDVDYTNGNDSLSNFIDTGII